MKAKTVYKARLFRPVFRRNERVQFSKKICSLLLQGHDVIFADETSTSLWGDSRIKKTWMHIDKAIPLSVNTTRGSNMTIMGAVGNCLPELVFKVYEKTEAKTFRNFLIYLKGQVQQQYRRSKPTLVLDNLACHKSESVAKHYDAFHVLFLPAYSSQMNSQETVWSVLKKMLSKYFARLPIDIKRGAGFKSEFKSHIETVLSQMRSEYSPDDFMLAIRRDLEEHLNDCL